jgi:hypothetical protein
VLIHNLQEDAVPSTKTRVDKIANVVVPVADQDRAIEFYVDKLGLEKRVDIPFGGQYRWVEVAPEGADTTIALAPPPSSRTPASTLTPRSARWASRCRRCSGSAIPKGTRCWSSEADQLGSA